MTCEPSLPDVYHLTGDYSIGMRALYKGRVVELCEKGFCKDCIFNDTADPCPEVRCRDGARIDEPHLIWKYVDDSESEEDTDEDGKSDDIPKALQADLPLGTEHEYNGRTIRLVKDDGEDHGCPRCVFGGFGVCVDMHCIASSRKDRTAVHWAYVDELDDDEEEAPKAKPAPKAKAKSKPAAPKSVAVVEESADGGAQG